jgi:hypothetical protein
LGCDFSRFDFRLNAAEMNLTGGNNYRYLAEKIKKFGLIAIVEWTAGIVG